MLQITPKYMTVIRRNKLESKSTFQKPTLPPSSEARPLKYWCPAAMLHSMTIQKNSIWNLTVPSTLYLANHVLFPLTSTWHLGCTCNELQIREGGFEGVRTKEEEFSLANAESTPKRALFDDNTRSYYWGKYIMKTLQQIFLLRRQGKTIPKLCCSTSTSHILQHKR